MTVEIIGLRFFAKCVNFSIVEVFCFSDAKHFLAFCVGKEFALFVKKFQSVPLLWIVRGCDDDTTASIFPHHCQFGGRGGSQTDVHNIEAHAFECANHYVEHHFAREASVASNHDFI